VVPTMNDSQARLLCSLSMDVDNQWSYMKTHGDPGWDSYPSYLDVLIPYALDVLRDHDLKTTFFIVGEDAARDKNEHALSQICAAGHTVGNHSYTHEPWLHLYEKSRIHDEISRTEEAIERMTGAAPTVFRGPGFSWSESLLEVLVEHGYTLDASSLPTFIGPLARLYYFWTADLSDEEKAQRSELFGTIADGFRPVRPYSWGLGSGAQILEIPVTTMPLFRTPFHLSYLLYLSRFSFKLMQVYLKTALFLCRMTGTEPSFLLHPLDFLGGDQVPELAFFPGMDLSADAKRLVVDWVLSELRRHFDVVDMYTHAESVLRKGLVRVRAIA
jgi:peptidoglycan-N-acetylglucosamine deacetylase